MKWGLLAAVLLLAAPASAEAPFPRLDAPLLEAPYNTPDHRWPSMTQSLRFSEDLYLLAHWGIAQLDGDRPAIWRRMLTLLATAAFDVVSEWLPLGNAFVHEEFHRAALGRRGIDSYDGVWDLHLFASSISVYGVRDEDLIALKRDHPAEQVRMASAGMEGEVELCKALGRDAIFEDARGTHFALAWLALVNAWYYLYSGTLSGTDDEIRAWTAADTTVASRDFDGHDFTSWVYDLFRPDEPYAARGPHPTGVGIQRYILVSQLTARERGYLELQSGLFALNALDPQLWGFRGFWASAPWGGRPLHWTASVRHELTPFGFVLEGTLLARQESLKLAFTVRAYGNAERGLPGLDAELVRYPITSRLHGSARLALWLQPEHQLFHDTGARPGGLLSLRIGARLFGPVGLYAEAEGKTPGWVAGQASLDAAISARIGVLLQP